MCDRPIFLAPCRLDLAIGALMPRPLMSCLGRLSTCRPCASMLTVPRSAGTLTQNNMVVSRLWLAGQLLPDLKPYTRREAHRQGASTSGAGLAARALAAASGSAGAGAGAAASSGPPPPLGDLVRSTMSTASLGGSGSADDNTEGVLDPRASVGALTLPGSGPPPDVAQLLVESVALNSTANIYTDKDGAPSVGLVERDAVWGPWRYAAPAAVQRHAVLPACVPECKGGLRASHRHMF